MYRYIVYSLYVYTVLRTYLCIYIYMHIIIPYEPTSPIQPIISQSVNPSRRLLGMHQLSWLSWLIFHDWGTPDLPSGELT